MFELSDSLSNHLSQIYRCLFLCNKLMSGFCNLCRILQYKKQFTLVSYIEFKCASLLKSTFHRCSKEGIILHIISERFNKNSVLFNQKIMQLLIIKRNHIQYFRKRSPVKLFSLQLSKRRLSVDRMLKNVHLRKWVNQTKILEHYDFVHFIKPKNKDEKITCNKIYLIWKQVDMSRFMRGWRRTLQCKFFCTI